MEVVVVVIVPLLLQREGTRVNGLDCIGNKSAGSLREQKEGWRSSSSSSSRMTLDERWLKSLNERPLQITNTF